MAVKDKLISNEVLKVVNDNMQGQVSDLKSAIDKPTIYKQFVQGSRYYDIHVLTNSARCTTAEIFELGVGATLSVSGNSSGQKYAVAGADGSDWIHDSGWQTGDYNLTITNPGYYFVNVAYTDGTTNIKPSAVTLTVTITTSSVLRGVTDTAYPIEVVNGGQEMMNGIAVDKIAIDLPPSANGYTTITLTKRAPNIIIPYIEDSSIVTEGQDEPNVGNRCRTKYYTTIKPGTEYTLIYSSTATIWCGVFFYDEKYDYIDVMGWAAQPRTFTTPANAKYVRFTFNNGEHPTNLRLYETDGDKTLTLNVDTLTPQTVIYGGRIEIDKYGYANISSQYAKVLGSALTWAENGTYANIYNGTYINADYKVDKSAIFGTYERHSSNDIFYYDDAYAFGSNGKIVYVKDTSYSTLASFTSAIANVALVYPLLNTHRVYTYIDKNAVEFMSVADGSITASAGDLSVYYAKSPAEYVQERTYIEAKSYFVNEISTTIDSINALMTEPAFVFPLITDIHYGVDSMNSFQLQKTVANIKAVGREIRYDAFVCLGDVIDGEPSVDTAIKFGNEASEMLKSVGAPYLYVAGNHDNNRNYTTPMTPQVLNRVFYSKGYNQVFRNPNHFGQDYYIDYPAWNLRIIGLDSVYGNQYRYSDETVAWFENVALNVPDDYLTVVLTHLSPVASHNYNNTNPVNGSEISDAISAHHSAGKSIVEFYGHNHCDTAFTSPYLDITSNCSKYEIDNGDPNLWPAGAVKAYRESGTANEDCWDVVVIRPLSKKINLVRFGAGDDREFNYTGGHTLP